VHCFGQIDHKNHLATISFMLAWNYWQIIDPVCSVKCEVILGQIFGKSFCCRWLSLATAYVELIGYLLSIINGFIFLCFRASEWAKLWMLDGLVQQLMVLVLSTNWRLLSLRHCVSLLTSFSFIFTSETLLLFVDICCHLLPGERDWLELSQR